MEDKDCEEALKVIYKIRSRLSEKAINSMKMSLNLFNKLKQ